MQYFEIAFLIVLVTSQGLGRTLNGDEIDLLRDNKGVDSSFRQFLEVKLRNMLREGNETLGLPVMDPFVKDESNFNIEQDDIVSADVQLKNLKVEGLSDYTVTQAIVGIIARKLTVGFHFSTIKAEGLYKADGNLPLNDDLHIFGDGLFNAIFNDFYIDAVVKFSVMGEFNIKSINLKIHLRESKVIATGIFNDEESSLVTSELISELIPQLIEQYHDKITSVIVQHLMTEGNILLQGKTLKDVLTMLG